MPVLLTVNMSGKQTVSRSTILINRTVCLLTRKNGLSLRIFTQALQATAKRIDLAYNAFFQGLRKLPKFKSARTQVGLTQPLQGGKPTHLVNMVT